MYGYFKARRRFFLPERFKESDVQFICKRLNTNFDELDLSSYNPKTCNRHRKINLDYFGYAPFKVSIHHPIITELIENPLWSFDRANLVFTNA